MRPALPSIALTIALLSSGCMLDRSGIGGAEDASRRDGGDPRRDAEAGACGDGVADGTEECDGHDLRGASCSSRGFAFGELGCDADCLYDTAACVDCPDMCDDATAVRCAGTERQACGPTGTPGCMSYAVIEDCGASGQLCRIVAGATECFGGDGDTCEGPLAVLSLPFTIGGAELRADFADDHAFGGAGCPATTPGPELVLAYSMAAGETVRFTETGSIDATLVILGACGDAEACLAGTFVEDTGLWFTAPSDGVYSFVVQGPASGGQGYAVTLEHPPAGNLCTDAIDASTLPAVEMRLDVDDAYSNAQSFDGGTCFNGAGPEVIFARAMTAGETVRLSEHGAIDTVLHVLASCSDGAMCLRSADREADGLPFTARTDGTYFFVVDATSTGGSREIDARLEDPPPGNLCTDPADGSTLPFEVDGPTIDREFTNEHRFTGSGCLPWAGPEIIVTRTMAAGEPVRLRELGGLDTWMYVQRGACNDAAPCLRSDDREAQGLTFTAPAADVYSFIVEALGTGGNRAFDVVLDAPPPGNVCAAPLVSTGGATDLSGADVDATFSDEHQLTGAGCPLASGTEVVVARAMTAGQTVRFTERAGLDVSLSVLASCSDTAACLRATTTEDPGLSFTAPSTGTFYFVLEAVGAGGSRAYDAALAPNASGHTSADPHVLSTDNAISGTSFRDFTDDQT
ncbi:MAG: hypothetical protein AB7S26_17530, partial [Sandaracinaceae bacterium]